MEISIRNCNNIDEGSFSIKIGCLNIKYGINGTGKTTITKALEAFINNNGDGIDSLKPFKYLDTNDKDHSPSLTGYETINTLAIFNEAYINYSSL